MLILGCKPPKENPIPNRKHSTFVYKAQLDREFPGHTFIVKNVRGVYYVVHPYWTEEQTVAAQTIADTRMDQWDEKAREELKCLN